jgi:hypothetical protein
LKPFQHARGSVARWGGKTDDYILIHDFLDSSKAHVPDMRHRMLLHHSFGIYLCEQVFGTTIVNSDGRAVSVRDIAEHHVIEDIMKALRKRGEEVIPLLFSKFFETHGDVVEAVAWTQYTPHFNDGEPCEFSVHEPRIRIKIPGFHEDAEFDAETETSYDAFLDTSWDLKHGFEEGGTFPQDLKEDVLAAAEAVEEIGTVLQDSGVEDAMRLLFGDHVHVTVTAKKTYINDYEHD